VTATLEALRDARPEAAESELTKALNLRNNFLVAKAAALTLHHRLTGLTSNLPAGDIAEIVGAGIVETELAPGVEAVRPPHPAIDRQTSRTTRAGISAPHFRHFFRSAIQL
jgi:hypothetical protein